MDAKERKRLYGVTMAPTPCTEAWRRSMPFDHNNKGIVTFSFILINRYTGTRTHVNTYNGETGPGFNAKLATYSIKKWGEDGEAAEKDLQKALHFGKERPYHRCRISDCPAAILASPPEGWQGEPLVEPAMPELPTPPESPVNPVPVNPV